MPETHPLVFYRKYRPQTFGEVINQEHIKKTLENAVRLNRVGHAYLFTGPRGTGKTTVARIFAKAINCVNTDVEPCNICEICKDFNLGRAPDLIEIDAASNRSIDDIRELRDGIKFSPFKVKYKVFIIDEAHQLTKDAFGALLKTLEEPPEHAIFIFATTEPERMPATIISRTQRFDFKRITIREIESKLFKIAQNERISVDSQALHLIASAAEGSFRDAESVFSQIAAFHGADETITLESVESILGAMNFMRLRSVFDFLAEKNAGEALKFLQEAVTDGFDAHELSRMILGYLRKILILKIEPELKNVLLREHTDEEIAALLDFSEKFDIKTLARLVRSVMQAHPLIKRSTIPILPLELAIIETYTDDHAFTGTKTV